jgi:hypothetical protein
MLSLSITFPPGCAERTNLLSQTSLKTLIELSKKCRWSLVISVLDPPEQIEAMFPKLDASQIAGISATKFAFPKQQKEPRCPMTPLPRFPVVGENSRAPQLRSRMLRMQHGSLALVNRKEGLLYLSPSRLLERRKSARLVGCGATRRSRRI